MLSNIPADNVRSFADEVINDPSSLLFASLADFYRENGLCQEAINMCQVGLESHPDHIEGRLVLARCYKSIEDYKKARMEITKILSLQSENSQAKKILEELDKLIPADVSSGPAVSNAFPQRQTSFDGMQPTVAGNSSEDILADQSPVAEVSHQTIRNIEIAITNPLDISSAVIENITSKALEVVETAPIAKDDEKENNEMTVLPYSHILAEIIKTPQVYGSLLVDEVGYPIASVFSDKISNVDEEASGATSALVYTSAAEAIKKIRLGKLERVVIDIKAEKLFLSKAGSQTLIISADNSAKVGLINVSLKKALDKIRSLTQNKTPM